MEFTKKIDFLLSERHLSKYKFANESSIPYTTVMGWYSKGTEQIKRSNLIKIANFFGVTLDFIMDDEIGISELQDHRIQENQSDSEIIKKYNMLDESSQQQVQQFIDFLGNQTRENNFVESKE